MKNLTGNQLIKLAREFRITLATAEKEVLNFVPADIVIDEDNSNADMVEATIKAYTEAQEIIANKVSSLIEAKKAARFARGLANKAKEKEGFDSHAKALAKVKAMEAKREAAEKKAEELEVRNLKAIIKAKFNVVSKKRVASTLRAELNGLIADERKAKEKKSREEWEKLAAKAASGHDRAAFKNAIFGAKSLNEKLSVIANAKLTERLYTEAVQKLTEEIVELKLTEEAIAEVILDNRNELRIEANKLFKTVVTKQYAKMIQASKAEEMLKKIVADDNFGSDKKDFINAMKAIIACFIAGSKRKPRKIALKALKEMAGTMEVASIPQIVARKVQDSDKAQSDRIAALNVLREKYRREPLASLARKDGLIIEVRIQAVQASELMKEMGIEEGKLADKTMMLDMLTSKNMATLKFDSSLTDFNDSKEGDSNRDIVEELINLTKTGELGLAFDKNGLVTPLVGIANIDKALKERKEGQDVVNLGAFLVSPSGFRTSSMSLARVGLNGVECDDRYDVLDKVTGGLVSANFSQEKYEEYLEDETSLNKMLGRLSQPLAPQKAVCTVRNYVVFDNFCKNRISENIAAVGEKPVFVTMINGMNTINSKDGLTALANDLLEEVVDAANIQTRGGSLKCSSILIERTLMAKLYSELCDMGVEVVKYCVDGKILTVDQFNALSPEAKADFFTSLDMLTDSNSKKLKEDTGEVDVTILKVAKDTESSLSMVTVMMMLTVDPEATRKILGATLIKTINNALENCGVEVRANEDGTFQSVELATKKRLNSSSLTGEYFFGAAPNLVLNYMPMALAGPIANAIEGVKNKLNALKLDCNAVYSVVQADFGAWFGITLLAEDECFNRSFPIGLVSASRHPISGPLAVTTYRNLSIEEIRARILAADISDTAKEILLYIYENAQGFTIVPASNFLQEKHDGMDWDIDAKVFYLDKEIVDVLRQIPNGGVIVERTSDDYKDLPEEQEILKAQRLRAKDVHSYQRPHYPSRSKNEEKEEAKASKVGRRGTNYDGATVKGKKKNVAPVQTDLFCKIAASLFTYMSSTVSGVGLVATAYYNNQLLLLELKYGKNKAVKQLIVDMFKTYYDCSGNAKYVSPFEVEEVDGKTIYHISKRDCIDAVIAFRESNGDIEDLIAYLEDCCLGNRFPAETAIDAAKNFFKVVNYFNHVHIVKALGSDKNMEIVLADKLATDDIFKSVIKNPELQEIFGYSGQEMNMFQASLLTTKLKRGFNAVGEDGSVMDCKEALAESKLNNEVVCVPDVLGDMKLDLLEMTNDILIAIIVELEHRALTDEAVAKRAKLKSDINNMGSVSSLANMVRNISYSMMSAKNALENVAEIDKADDDANLSTKEFEKKILLPASKNFLMVCTSELSEDGTYKRTYTDKEIGAAAIYELLNGLKDVDTAVSNGLKLQGDRPMRTNSNMLRVLEKEIIVALNGLGVAGAENLGSNWERIKDVKDINEELIPASNIEGLIVEDGEVDGNSVRSYNKKAELNGEVVNVDDVYYVLSERDFVEVDPKAGLVFKIVNDYNDTDNMKFALREEILLTSNIPSTIETIRFESEILSNAERIATKTKDKKRFFIGAKNDKGAMELFNNSFISERFVKNMPSMDLDVKDVSIVGAPRTVTVKEVIDGKTVKREEAVINEGIVAISGSQIESVLAAMPLFDVVPTAIDTVQTEDICFGDIPTDF